MGDADSSQKLCDACLNVNTNPKINAVGALTTWKPNSNPERNCCGDDPGEGGYPYKSLNVQKSSIFSPTTNAGSYGREVCDDFWGGDLTKPIDNNCDGKNNCEDKAFCAAGNSDVYTGYRNTPSSRTLHLSQYAGLCCQDKTQCKAFLDPLGKDNGVACDANTKWECDCKLGGDDLNDPYITYNNLPSTIETCAAANTFGGDRLIMIKAEGMHKFTIEAKDIDADSINDCDGQVNIHVFNLTTDFGTDPQQIDLSTTPLVKPFYIDIGNVKAKDCLVKITIS